MFKMFIDGGDGLAIGLGYYRRPSWPRDAIVSDFSTGGSKQDQNPWVAG